jgi:hypothetical protein
LLSSGLSAQCVEESDINDPNPNWEHLEAMNIPCAWGITNGNPAIKVAVGDHHFDDSHIDLAGKIVEIVEGNIGSNCGNSSNENYHGIQSLGAISAIRNNGNCVAGSGGLTRVGGFCGGVSDNTIDDMVGRGYKIISVSAWSGISKTKLEEVTAQGVVVLVAGLDQHHQAGDPNGYHSVPGVIHCGRAKLDGDFWQYNKSPNTDLNMNMDVLAVTQDMYRLRPGSSCAITTTGGTSIGTPHIAGVVALMMDVNPCLTPSDYEEILVATSGPIPANAHEGATRGGIIDAYAAVLMAQNFPGIDKTWSGDQTISMDQVSGDLTVSSGANIALEGTLLMGSNRTITIESGAKLEVTGTIELGEDTRIIIKRGAEMIVDGGTITNAKGPNVCWESDQWEAIVIEGNANQPQQLPGNVNDPNGNGVLHLKNATIENGHTMITMKCKHIPYPQHPEYWGGHVTAENTTFVNTNNFTNYARVAEFMQYFPDDRSKFTGCTVSNVAGGMTHWSNFGVTYERNEFDSYQQRAILGYDTRVIVVNGNTFENNLHDNPLQAAIDLNHTFSLEDGSIIGDNINNHIPNSFYGGFHSIYSSAGFTSELPISVENNIFVGGASSIYFDGISTHSIKGNDIIGSTHGTTINANGSSMNIQRDNQFSETDVGIYAFFENSGYQFLSNCFDNTRNLDVSVYGGLINSGQGNIEVAASNVFSQLVSKRRIRMEAIPVEPFGTPLDPELFQYYIESETPQIIPIERTYPRVFINGDNVTDDHVAFESENFDNENCGSSTSPGPVNLSSSFRCDLPDTCDDLPDFVSDLEDDLASEILFLQSETQGSIDWYKTKNRITEILRCLQNAKRELIYCMGIEEKYDVIKQIFGKDKFEYRVLVYGTMVGNRDYKIARNYLNEISASNEEELDFVTTQHINLDRLENYTHIPSPTDLTTLYTIGHKTYPLSAYARSLYRYLTGDKIELDLPYQEGDNSNNGTRSVNVERMTVVLSPNPSQGQFGLEYDNFPESSCVVYNSQGEIVMDDIKMIESGSINVDLSNQNSGVYILLIRAKTTGKLLNSEKLIIVK